MNSLRERDPEPADDDPAPETPAPIDEPRLVAKRPEVAKPLPPVRWVHLKTDTGREVWNQRHPRKIFVDGTVCRRQRRLQTKDRC